MKYVIAILSLQSTLIHAALMRLLSDVLLIFGLLQLTKQMTLNIWYLIVPWIIVYHTHQMLIYFILIYNVSLTGLESCVHNVNNLSVWYLDHQDVWSVLTYVFSSCTIIVLVAGILLVVCLYLLNLTVTKGTINGIILYANIISINDSYFRMNNNAFIAITITAPSVPDYIIIIWSQGRRKGYGLNGIGRPGFRLNLS